jgi:hypothetical protein
MKRKTNAIDKKFWGSTKKGKETGVTAFCIFNVERSKT